MNLSFMFNFALFSCPMNLHSSLWYRFWIKILSWLLIWSQIFATSSKNAVLFLKNKALASFSHKKFHWATLKSYWNFLLFNSLYWSIKFLLTLIFITYGIRIHPSTASVSYRTPPYSARYSLGRPHSVSYFFDCFPWFLLNSANSTAIQKRSDCHSGTVRANALEICFVLAEDIRGSS